MAFVRGFELGVKQGFNLKGIAIFLLHCYFLVFVACVDASANSEKIYLFELPQQSLAKSLNHLSDISETSFLFPYDLVDKKIAKPLRGRFTLAQALVVLLEGTGLEGEFAGQKAFLIRAKPLRKNSDIAQSNDEPEPSLLTSILSTLFNTNEHSVTSDEEAEIEIVEVHGIASTIVNARNAKLSHDGIVDTYFAEDIGKSSDEDITSALQRLPGVAIERGGEGGDQGTVVVRGIQPSLNLIKFNGITLTSNTDNQAVDLSNYSADVLSSIVVAKSYSAKDEEGSLGGTVYLNSLSPLAAKRNQIIVSGEARYNDLTNQITPRTTVSFNKRFYNNLGVTGSFFWDDNESRIDNFETFLGAFVDQRNQPFDQNGNQLATRAALSDGLQNYRTFLRETDKKGGTLTLHWQPNEDRSIRLDSAFAKQSQDFLLFEDRGARSSFGQERQAPGLVTVDTASGRVTDYLGDFSGLLQTREQRGDTENLIIGLSIDQTIAEHWQIQSKLTYAKTRQLFDFQTWNLIGIGNADLNEDNSRCGYGIQPGDGVLSLPVFSDCLLFDRQMPETLAISGGSQAERDVVDRHNGIYFDFARNFDHSGITSVDFGIKYTEREKQRFFGEAFFGINTLLNRGFVNEQQIQQIDNERTFGTFLNTDISLLQRAPGNVLVGIAPEAGPSFYAPDIEAINAYLFPDGVPSDLTIRNPSEQWIVKERTQAVYLQTNFSLFDDRVTGNVGVRYVDTRVEGIGAGGFQFSDEYITPAGRNYPSIFTINNFEDENEYGQTLPSLNIRYEVNDAFIFRLSAARVMARPSFDSLAPGFSIIDRDPGAVPRGNGGNTQLAPFISEQFDFSTEWYFDPNSVLSATVFDKKLTSFTFNSTTSRNFENPLTGEPCLVNRSNAPIDEEQLTATVTEFGCASVLYSTEVNGARADITGIELGYSQVYDFLPGLWQYLGLAINYTYVDSEVQVNENLESAENGLPFPNTSKNSINSLLFWENDTYSFRIAHTYRDEALIEVNNNNQTIIRDARAILDFSANWQVTDRIVLTFVANNLTNSYDYLYQVTLISDDPNIPVQLVGSDISSVPKDAAFRVNHLGRSYRLGFRYSF